jgi:hypothetical protein
MPVVDGDMWFECRMLMEACRFYDIETVAALACSRTGFNASHLPEAALHPSSEPNTQSS